LNNLIKRVSHYKIVIGITIAVLILDQLTKYLARIYLEPVHSVSIIGNFFRLTYVENPGIAFGIRIENKIFFAILSILAVVVIIYYVLTLRDRPVLQGAFALILGGAFGNLLDRFIYGRVVDFMDFNFFNVNLPSFKFLFFSFNGYSMNRWPVFNVADMAVSLGMIIIIITALVDDKPKQTEQNAIPEQD